MDRDPGKELYYKVNTIMCVCVQCKQTKYKSGYLDNYFMDIRFKASDKDMRFCIYTISRTAWHSFNII